MILQTLTEYHQEQLAVGNPNFAPEGMSLKRIHFVLVLAEEGTLLDVEQPTNKLCVAKSRERGGKDAVLIANLLWDSLGYVTGYGDTEKQQRAATVQYHAFVEQLRQIQRVYPNNRSLKAVARFYDHHTQELHAHPLWQTIISETGHNISFRVEGEALLTAQQKEVVEWRKTGRYAMCVVSGEVQPTVHTHPKIYMAGGAPTGAKLVSFSKCSGYDSYEKHGSENAPVSEAVADGYTSALTGLLQKESGRSVGVGEVTFVFFTLPESDFCESFYNLLGVGSFELKQEALKTMSDNLSADVEFVMMAFVPNAARISTRLYVRMPVLKLVENLIEFHRQTALNGRFGLNETLSILTPLFAMAHLGKSSKLPPQLIVDYVEAVVKGGRFPVLMQQILLRRVVEGATRLFTLYAMLRGYVNRNTNITISMALDQKNENKGYLIGRLFAIIERAQVLSNHNENFTIRDVYYATISVTPSAVFNRLIALSGSFFRRIPSQGSSVYLKSQLSQVMEMLDTNGIPMRLSLDEQSCFALGYFHQRQVYFTKKIETNEESN